MDPSFTNKKKELNQRFFIIVDEVVKTYPNFKSNPDSPVKSEIYKKNISNLDKLQLDYFLFKNDLEKRVDNVHKEVKQIDDDIYELDEENKRLKRELALLVNGDNAAGGRLVDSRALYNIQFTGNIILFIIIATLIKFALDGKHCNEFICIEMAKNVAKKMIFRAA